MLSFEYFAMRSISICMVKVRTTPWPAIGMAIISASAIASPLAIAAGQSQPVDSSLARLIDEALRSDVPRGPNPRDITEKICPSATESSLQAMQNVGVRHTTDIWNRSVYYLGVQSGLFSGAYISISFDGSICRAFVGQSWL